MSKLFLDLKKFKKLKSDDKCTTFQHADGHTITVAHNKLTDNMRKQMEGLPLAEMKKDHNKEERKAPSPKKMADGGDVQQDPGYMDYLKYLAQKGMDQVGQGQQAVQNQVQLAQQQVHNPNMQLTPEQQAAQQQYFQNVAGAVAGGVAPVKGAAMAAELATPERAAMNAAYENIPKGYAPEAAENLVRKTDMNSRAMDFAQRTKDQLKARRGYADGGNVADTADKIVQDAAAQAGPQAVSPEQLAQAQQSTAPMAEQVAPVQPSVAAFAKGVEDSSIAPSYASPQEKLATAQALTKQAEADAALGATGAPSTQAAQSNQASGPGSDGFMGNMQKAYDMQRQGIEQGAKAMSDLGEAKAEAADAQIQREADLMQKQQAAQQHAVSEHENFVKDVQNGYINPNHFMENQSAPRRVANAIGLLLGGIGGGVTHQENPALKFLNSQIDRDIQAQSSNLTAKNNLLAHNIQMLNSVQDGYRLTQAQMNSMYAHEIDKAASQSMGPQAQAAAQEAKGKLLGQSAMFLGQIGTPGNSQGDGAVDNWLSTMRVVNPARAKEFEDRYIPGVGIASRPLAEPTRQDIIGKMQFDQQMGRMIDWVKKNQGTVFDRAKVNEGKAMAAELAGAYRQASNGGVYKESEQDFINKLIPEDPSQFGAAIRTLPKLNELRTTNALRLNTAKQVAGLKPLPGAPTSSATANTSFQPKSFKPVK